MIIQKSILEAVAAKLNSYFDVTVEVGNTLFTVYCDSSKGLSEFETRVGAALWIEDGGEEIDSYLDFMVDLIDHRARFELMPGGGTWVAMYHNFNIQD